MNNLTPEQLAEFKNKYGLVTKDEVVEEKPKLPEFRTEISEYKGNPTITILQGDKRVLGFGLKKAIAIESCIDDIKKFIDSQGE